MRTRISVALELLSSISSAILLLCLLVASLDYSFQMPDSEMPRPLKVFMGFVLLGMSSFLAMLIVMGLSPLIRDWLTRPKPTTDQVERTNDQRPPKFAEYLLYFLPKKDREPLLGDLEEEYREIYEKFGRRKAAFWYYCQVMMSFLPYIVRGIKQLVGLGVVGWAGNAIRRWMG
jgi:hypothetical protein